MLKIAICDDENIFLEQMKEYIENVFFHVPVIYSVKCFSSGEDLFQDIERNYFYDIIFMDISMGGMSGVETGAKLRNYFDFMKTILIYVSAYDNRAKEVFHFNTHRFLSKPINFTLFEEALVSGYKLWKNAQAKHIIIKDRSVGQVTLPLKDILYFEVTRSHRVDVVTEQYKYTAYEKLSDIYEQLENSGFLLIHHSSIVNFDYIRLMTYDKVTMTDGKTLQISGPKRSDVRKQYALLRKNQGAQQWP